MHREFPFSICSGSSSCFRCDFKVWEIVVLIANLLRIHFPSIKMTMREREHSNSRVHKKIFLHHRCDRSHSRRRYSRAAQNRIRPTYLLQCGTSNVPLNFFVFSFEDTHFGMEIFGNVS